MAALDRRRGVRRSLPKRLGRWLWLVFAAIVGAATVVGYLAGYIHPRLYWWSGLAAILLPVLAAVSLVVAISLVVWFRAHRWLLVAYSILLVLLAVRFIHPSRFTRPDHSSPDDLVFMTFNVPRTGESEATSREMLALVTRHTPHVIGLQEATIYTIARNPDRLRAFPKIYPLIDSLGYRIRLPAFRPDEPRYAHWYQSTLSRLDIIDQREIVFDEVGLDRKVRSYGMRSVLRWNGRRIVHYNLHLWTYGYRKPWADDSVRVFDGSYWEPYIITARDAYLRRAHQAEQLREMIEAETDPVIVSGDFNGTQHNWAYRQISRGMKDAFAVGGSGWGGTYRADLPLVRIDFILADENWEIVQAYVPKVSRALSDHRPVIARLRLRDPAAD